MAVQQLQIPSSNINNTVDQTQWATLGNLGKVYQEAQAQARKQAALANLGTDPIANQRTLLTSGDPALAQLGLSLQEKGVEQAREDARYKVTDARAEAQLAIQKAQEARAQGNYEEADKWQAQLPALLAKLQGGAAPTAPAAAPFPAPLPGASPPTALPPTVPPAVPPPQQPVIPPQAAPSAFSATPILPSTLQPPAPAVPPVKAEGDDPSALPSWVQSAQAQPPDTSTVGRVVSNLTSGQAAAKAGISSEEISGLITNPLTRELGVAFLKNKLDPGTWTYHFDQETGRVIGTNSKTQEVKDVTPASPTGAAPVSKQQREYQGYYQAGKDLKMTDEQAAAFAANKGKMPSEDLHPDERKKISDLTDQANNGLAVVKNIDDLKEISKKAWGRPGALEQAQYVAGYLPQAVTPDSAIQTINLANAARQNVATMAKSIFGSRLAVAEVKLLDDLEGSANQPDAARQQIFDRAKTMIQKKISDANAEAEGIRNKTFYKPGGGATSPSPAAPAPATAPTAKPSLADFMKRAREANPGASDGDLARYWKDKYGG
jgi:hypothetical protein